MTHSSLDSRPEWLVHVLDAVDAQDAAKFVSYMSDDVEFVWGSAPPVRGREAVRQAVEAFLADFAELRHAVHRTWALPRALICEGSVSYRPHGAEPVTLPFCNVLDLDGGRIRRYRVYADPTPLGPSGSDA